MTSAFNAGKEIVGRMLSREGTDKLMESLADAPHINSLPEAPYAPDDPEVWMKLTHIYIEDI